MAIDTKLPPRDQASQTPTHGELGRSLELTYARYRPKQIASA